jgi:hypothetical protein
MTDKKPGLTIPAITKGDCFDLLHRPKNAGLAMTDKKPGSSIPAITKGDCFDLLYRPKNAGLAMTEKTGISDPG